MRGFFAPREFKIDVDYFPLLSEIKAWVDSRPVCDSILFLDDNQFKPIVRNNQPFSPSSMYPYAFIKSLPATLETRIYQLLPVNIRTEFGVLPHHVRIFCNKTSLDWHTDAPYRHRAINIAVSDAIGDSKTRYLVKNPADDTTKEFQYQFKTGYIVDINSQHKVETEFVNPVDLRLLISFSID